MWHFAGLQFAKIIFFAICGPQPFYGLKTSASPQIQTFLLTNTAYIMLYCNSNLYKIKNHLKTTFMTVLCDRLVHYFVEICGFADLSWNLRICDFFCWQKKVSLPSSVSKTLWLAPRLTTVLYSCIYCNKVWCLKGLSPEIDFKNFDKKLHNLA